MPAASSNALPENYRLDEYVIQSVLGQGGFGITYLARDARLGAMVAVKEYFPQAYAQRDRTATIRPNTHAGDTSDIENYKWGLQEFLKEARALAQFKHANIVRVLRFLEANGTAYMVMEYEEGESLSEHLAHHGGFLGEPVLLNIFLPVLNGLQAVHDAGLLHLDIKPDNIYLRRNGPPMLIDFGAARQRQGGRRSEKVALTPGYCALEQYPGFGELGPWSDVYSMGATLYRCIVGREPVDARERVQGLKKLHVDPLIPATRFDRPHYSPHIRSSVDAALTLKAADDRPRSALALQNGLMGKELSETRKTVAENAYTRGPGFIGVVQNQEAPTPKRRYIPRGPLEIGLVVLVFLAVLVVAPVRIMMAYGMLSESELLDQLDQLHGTVVEHGKRATRYVEENLFGIRRPPEYVATPASPSTRRKFVVPAPVKAVPVFHTGMTLATTASLPGVVVSLTLIKNGEQAVLGYDDGRVEIRALADGHLARSLQPVTGVPAVVAATADGRFLAFNAREYAIHIWDMDKNIFLMELTGHVDAVTGLAFSPDGQRLASVGRDQNAYLWNVGDGQLLQDLSKPSNEPLAVTFSPDGNLLAVSDSAGGIRYWNLGSLRDIAYVPTRDLPVSALAYSPDGKYFALGGEQGFLGLWRVGGHDDRELSGGPDTVHAVVFSPDSKWLIVAGSDASLQLWNTESGQPEQYYSGGNHQTYALALAPEGRTIVTAGADGKLNVWREPVSASASPVPAP